MNATASIDAIISMDATASIDETARIKASMPESIAATLQAGRVKPCPHEWDRLVGTPLHREYPYVLEEIFKHNKPSLDNLAKLGVQITSLDLTTGTSQEKQNLPTFIRPIAQSKIHEFITAHPPLECSLKHDDAGYNLLWLLSRWTSYQDEDDDEADVNWLNPTWTQGYIARWNANFLETTDPDNLPHITTFVYNRKTQLGHGKITTTEILAISGALKQRRKEYEGRYVPVTVFSAAPGSRMRVLHAWDDKEDPYTLQVLVSPAVEYRSLSENEDWIKVLCFMMGDPVLMGDPVGGDEAVVSFRGKE